MSARALMLRGGSQGLVLAALALGVSACGYRAEMEAPAERLGVELRASEIAYGRASREVVVGVRRGLARYGALRSGSATPRVVVEVLRVDEQSDAVGRAPGQRDLPEARSVQIAVVARAWIEREAGDPPSADTGDMQSVAIVGAPVDGELGGRVLRREDAIRTVARRLGERLAMRLLGHPVNVEDSIDLVGGVPD